MATKDDIIRAIEEDEKSTQDVGKAQFYSGASEQNKGVQQGNPADTPAPSTEKEAYMAGQANATSVDVGKEQFHSESSSTPADAQPTVDKPQLETVAPALPAQKKAADKALKMKPAEIKAPTIEDIIRKTEPKRQLSEEDEAIIKRRANREALIGAISDGLSAMANIYFTGQGTKSAYDASSNLAPRAKKRWDDWMAQRNAEMERNYQDYQVKERERKAEERAKKAAEYAAAKDQRDYELNMRKVNNDAMSNALRAQEMANRADQHAAQLQFKQDELKAKSAGRSKSSTSNRIANVRISPTENVEIPEYQYNEMIDALWTFIPDDEKKSVGAMRKDGTRAEATATQIKNYVLARLQTNEAMQDFVRSLSKGKQNAPTPKPSVKGSSTETTKKPSPTATAKKKSPTQ